MAIYRLEAKILGRQAKDRQGNPILGRQVSILAKAAYRAAERLCDQRSGQTFDYRSRNLEVVHRSILAPDIAPAWLHEADSRETREHLWNEIERVEKRKDSQLAREFIISLPVELDLQAQVKAIEGWCEQELVSKGFVVDVAIHRSRDEKNPHAHLLVTTRTVGPDGFGPKPKTNGKFYGRGVVGKDAKSDLEVWRESWAKAENQALEEAGSEARVDHRSLSDRGVLDRLPEPKIGNAALHMQRSGKVHDPDRVRETRRVRVLNTVLPMIREVERDGEVHQAGLGMNWQDRASGALGRFYDQARDFIEDESSGGTAWRDYVEKKRQRERDADSEMSR